MSTCEIEIPASKLRQLVLELTKKIGNDIGDEWVWNRVNAARGSSVIPLPKPATMKDWLRVHDMYYNTVIRAPDNEMIKRSLFAHAESDPSMSSQSPTSTSSPLRTMMNK
jgi:hypothetical protein